MPSPSTIEAANSIAQGSVGAQVWLMFLFIIFGAGWVLRRLSIELKEQASKREQLLNELTRVVEHNTRVVEDNTKVLSDARYQMKRSTETLEKFI